MRSGAAESMLCLVIAVDRERPAWKTMTEAERFAWIDRAEPLAAFGDELVRALSTITGHCIAVLSTAKGMLQHVGPDLELPSVEELRRIRAQAIAVQLADLHDRMQAIEVGHG